MFHDMFHDMFVHKSGLGRAQGAPYEASDVDDTVTICFTICKTMFHDMFVHWSGLRRV